MTIERQEQVTEAVLKVMEQTNDPRLREIMVSLITHLHGFIRDVRLTEDEFRNATAIVNEIGKLTTDTHNEAVLMSGSLGVSALVCLLNNGNNGATETTQNLLGPFWRLNSPITENDSSIVRSDTPGEPMVVTFTVTDQTGSPIEGAEVDIWHSSPAGFYENQDPDQADMNLRGKFTTDETGEIRFRSIRPAGYPIPTDGLVGCLLAAQNRHPYRPAHVHALAFKDGFKTLITQIYADDDPRLETDVQFGVTKATTGHFVRHDEAHPDIAGWIGPWYSLDHTLVMEPGEARLPQPPIK
ncbi:dioxygenase [uncultured Roseibium sp.]|uniref:dioxygenase family protein n=1 Tax=uncultured Roseibium sp. TaxID=1936171 RepID=UPI003216EAD3